jgi:hypothetical protein
VFFYMTRVDRTRSWVYGIGEQKTNTGFSGSGHAYLVVHFPIGVSRGKTPGNGIRSGGVRRMEEGRKRVLGIIAGILVARHLKTTEDLHDNRPSPRTESLVASAVQWAERIMKRIDGTFADSADDKRWPRA